VNIKVIELCGYGPTADYEAVDLDNPKLDMSYIPEGWEFTGGNDEARKFAMEIMELQVYNEGKLIIFGAPSGTCGKDMARKLLEEWPRI